MDLPTGEIAGITFYPLSSKQIEEESVVRIIEPGILDADGRPVTGGIYPAQSGTTFSKYNCATCRKGKDEGHTGHDGCTGHAAHIDLPCAVMNPVFNQHVTNWSRIVCLSCGACMMTDKMMESSRCHTFGRVKDYCAKNDMRCPQCDVIHPHVEKTNKVGILSVTELTEEESVTIKKKMERGRTYFLYPYQLLDAFKRVTPQTLEKLGVDPRCHPANYLLEKILILPVTMRPTVMAVDSPTINNSTITSLVRDIVVKMQEISEVEMMSVANRKNGQLPDPSDELGKKMLELNVATAAYLFVEKTTSKGNKSGRQCKPPSQLLAKKKGFVRGNATGKRVFKVGRGFIVGDSTMPLDHIGLPIDMASQIFLPRLVTEDNYDQMNVCFMNGPNQWPGSRSVETASGNKRVAVVNQGKYQLKVGDVLHTHVFDGDMVGFNRQPSLLPSSIAAMKVRIVRNLKVIVFNEIICNLFNADFDGDAMLVIFVQSPGARAEMAALANTGQHFRSLQSGDPTMGLLLDSLIGMIMLSQAEHIPVGEAMALFSGTSAVPDFNAVGDERGGTKDGKGGNTMTGRQVLSLYFKTKGYLINYRGRSTYYDKNYEQYIGYRPDDYTVVIRSGEVVSGTFDKAIVGQGQKGSIFHVISNVYGVKEAMTAVYDMQQMAIAYSTCRFSITLRDLLIDRASLDRIQADQRNKYDEVANLCRLFDSGSVTPPVDMNLRQYFEQRLIVAMKEDKWSFIMKDRFAHNNLMRSIVYGVKGNMTNLGGIARAVGLVTTKGTLVANKISGRQSPYMLKDDSNAEAFGYNPNSYVVGNSVGPLFAQYVDGRATIVDKALTTADAGDASRKGARCAEDIKVNAMLQMQSHKCILQMICGVDGADPRRSHRIELDMMKVCDVPGCKHVDDNGNTHEGFDAWNEDPTEFEKLRGLRGDFERLTEEMKAIGYLDFGPDLVVPVNPKFIIEGMVDASKGTDASKGMEKKEDAKKDGFDASQKKAYVARVDRLTEDLAYSLFGKAYRRSGKKVPEYAVNGLHFQMLAVRCWLSLHKLKVYDVSLAMLDVICDEIVYKYMESRFSFGLAVGLIASQSLAQPLTQMILNSIHSSHGANGVDRYREIAALKPTKGMVAPKMRIELDDDTDKMAVTLFAKNLEQIFMRDVVQGCKMFWEAPLTCAGMKGKGGDGDKDKSTDERMVKDFLRYSGSRAPDGLTNWCIRLTLNKYKMIEKFIEVDAVVRAVYKHNPGLWIAHTNDNDDEVVLRVYVKAVGLPKGEGLDRAKALYENIRNTLLRGVDGIIRADVKEGSRRTHVKGGDVKDKKTSTEKFYYVETLGTNLRQLLRVKGVRKDRLTSNSIHEVREVFGIFAARNKIVTEMAAQVGGISAKHIMTMAALMTYRGHLDPLSRHGNIKGGGSVLMSMVYGAPHQILRTAGMYGYSDKADSIAGALLLSQPLNIGSMYNELVVNEKFVKENTVTMGDVLDEI